ncbi:MAG: hypothetical protein Q9162_002999 [Coniocarpon cinnabarinum]
MSAHTDKSKPYFPLSGTKEDQGYSKEDEATATCFCGTVQLAFITASMFASNFTVKDTHLKHLRGQGNLKTFGQAHSIGSKQLMTNYFCGTCGTLMYRVGARFPGMSILRIGTIDDFNLADTKIRPTIEQFTKERANWLTPVKGATETEGTGM